MPLIVIQRAHGCNDAPLGYALLKALSERGILDKFDVAMDPWLDPCYVELLKSQFPSLAVLSGACRASSYAEKIKAFTGGRGYKYLANLNRADAVIEAPGGRITPVYTGNTDIFWMYPRVKRRAIAFHSIEAGILNQPKTRASIGATELVIARTSASAEIARVAGAGNVVESCDIALNLAPSRTNYRAGVAVALRVPNYDVSEEYLARLDGILDCCENLPYQVDHVRVEEPVGRAMVKRGYAFPDAAKTRMFSGDLMYHPFASRRDAIISCRLHTTLISLLHGNRKVLQFHVENGSTKLQQFVDDLGLQSIPVLGPNDLTVDRVTDFLESTGNNVSEVEVQTALHVARQKVASGLDALCEWLDSI